MKLLKYKGVLFESFSSYLEGKEDYKDEASMETIREGESIYSYICPECILANELYKETDTTETEVNNMIDENQESYAMVSPCICCVKDCENLGGLDIDFENEHCELIERKIRKEF
jgi:hypothetical protein